MSVKYPAYLDELSEDMQRQARIRFLLRLAALYATPAGSLPALSSLCGYSDQTLTTQANSRHKISAEMALCIEKATGREVVSREDLCPEVFEKA